MYYKLFIATILIISAYWTGQNIPPQLKDGDAVPAALKSMLMLIAFLIMALLVLNSPWCPDCFVVGGM